MFAGKLQDKQISPTTPCSSVAAEEQKQLAVSPAVALQKPQQSFDDKAVKFEERIPNRERNSFRVPNLSKV